MTEPFYLQEGEPEWPGVLAWLGGGDEGIRGFKLLSAAGIEDGVAVVHAVVAASLENPADGARYLRRCSFALDCIREPATG